MKQFFMTIFAVFFSLTALGQGFNYGNLCDEAIYVDSTLVQPIEPNRPFVFTANTEDLPLVVYFFPDEEFASEPIVYVDLTCESGVYEDENVRAIVDIAAGLNVYFPIDDKGRQEVACKHCPYLSSNERMCQLNKEPVAYPTRYVGDKCPLIEIEEKE
jgi:hypothetical protein